MSYTVQTAQLGEYPLLILARAALYSDYMLPPVGDGAAQRRGAMVNRDQLAINRFQNLGDTF